MSLHLLFLFVLTVMPDIEDPNNQDIVRKEVLWGNIMAVRFVLVDGGKRAAPSSFSLY